MNVKELNVPKQRMRLEVAYDLISTVHSNLCRYESRSDTPRLSDETLEILRRLFVLDQHLKEYEK